MDYRVLKRNILELEKHKIIPVRYEDRYLIMEWRNAQVKILRQTSLLTKQQQDIYFDNVIQKLFDQDTPGQVIFSFVEENRLIGYGGLVHISWQDKRAEVSFLLDSNRIKNASLYGKEFSIFLTLIKQVAFDDLQFNRIYTETFDVRNHHIRILEDNQFILEGKMREHVFLDGSYRDSLIHGCLKSEYDAKK